MRSKLGSRLAQCSGRCDAAPHRTSLRFFLGRRRRGWDGGTAQPCVPRSVRADPKQSAGASPLKAEPRPVGREARWSLSQPGFGELHSAHPPPADGAECGRSSALTPKVVASPAGKVSLYQPAGIITAPLTGVCPSEKQTNKQTNEKTTGLPSATNDARLHPYPLGLSARHFHIHVVTSTGAR